MQIITKLNKMKRNLILLLASFLLLGSVYAQENHYTPIDADEGAMSLTVWGEVQIDNVQQTSNSIEIGMFVNDTCKASARVKTWFGQQMVKLYCVYDGENKPIVFKLYNHDNSEEMVSDYTVTTTGADMSIGGNTNPIVLNFVHETVPTYSITLTANPTEGGSVSGDGDYEENQEITVTATPNEGYTFVNWTENGTEVSTNASYTFTVTEARTLVANFEGSTPEPEYPWEPVDPSEGNTYASLTAIVQINGELITDGSNWELGAFYGTTCRGLGNLENGWVPIEEEYVGTGNDQVPYSYYMMMVVYGNSGEELSFKLYDLEAQEVFPGVCDVTVTYVPDAEWGDPWNPIILNFVTEETCFTLDITGYTNEGGYYLIATPIDEINPEEVVFIMDQEESTMTAGEFDLYYFDQNKELEWINYQAGEGSTDPGFNLVSGKGYLYANKQSGTLKFCGTPISGDSYEVMLSKDASNNPDNGFEGWNLVGNPFTDTAYIDRDFYIMNGDGSEIIAAADEGVEFIEPMHGVFVIAEEDGEILTFSKEPFSNNNSKLVISMKQERGNVIDRAIVRFNSERTLPKFMLNDNSTKLYIPQDNHEFAVVSANNETEEMPLSFKAAENGTYTLSVFDKDVTFEHLTLIDHLTGAEVNLLATPNYQFNANVNDPAARFSLLFRSNSNVSTAEQFNPILYRQNGQLTINGIEGDYELQMIDLLGRVISSTTANGDFNQTINVAPGVYSIRLTAGDQTYTQKIVVE